MKGQSTIRPQPPDRRAVSILVRSWTGWRGKPHLTYVAFLEVDRANTPRLDIAALQAEGIELGLSSYYSITDEERGAILVVKAAENGL